MVQKEVRNPLTDEILFGRLEQGGTVRIALRDGALAFEYDPPAEQPQPVADPVGETAGD